MIFRNVRIDGQGAVDVRITGGTVTSVGVALPFAEDDRVVDGRGRALLPGLHDHHVHLLATAASVLSVHCGPESVTTPTALAAALRGAPGTGWVRGVGYDESVAGELDRRRLDQLVADRPVRVQHRSGALWSINSAGLERLGRGAPDDGRLWRQDEWLRDRLGADAIPSLAALGERLAAYGVTGVTDATPGAVDALAVAAGELPQRVVTLGDTAGPGLELGPWKVVLGDHRLPTYAELVTAIRRARESGRAVAVHSVTRSSLLLLLAVLAEVGAVAGDRVEHAAVAPEEAVTALEELGVTVVTQPSLVAQRGDHYRDRVDPDDEPHLWRYGSLLSAGVRTLCSSDAPYGDLDPWASITAAANRRAPSGRIVGGAERVDPAVALDGFLADPLGLQLRRVVAGSPADLVLLDAPVDAVLATPDASHVRMTVIGGRVAYERSP